MKRKWIIGLSVCCVAVVCVLVFAAREDTQPLPLPSESQMRSNISVYIIYTEGELGGYLNLSPEQQDELLKMLRKAKAQPELNWSSEKVKMPAYEFHLTYKDDSLQFHQITAAYTNGYLVYDDGSVYRVDLPFKRFVNKHKLLQPLKRDGRKYHLYGFECFYWLAKGENGWNTKYLPLAEEPLGQDNVTIELNEWNDETITYTVDAKYGWSMGNGVYHLHVKLNDQWYKVPTLPGNGIEALPLISIGAGAYEKTVRYTDKYGTLPPGHYRFEIGDLSFEYTVK